MKFDIKNWRTGEIIFTAEIEATDDTPYGVQLGLAVRVAVGLGVSLNGAELNDAELNGAELNDAKLNRAELNGAELNRAIGNMVHVKSLQIERYRVTYTATDIFIGCKHASIDNIESLASRDDNHSRKWMPWLKHLVTEMSPAEPTGAAEIEPADADVEAA